MVFSNQAEQEALLVNLGLSSNQARLYLALVELGQTTTGPLIKQTGLNRVMVYDTLEKLIQDSLVICSRKSKTKYFSAEPPERLLEIIQEKKSQTEKLVKELERIHEVDQVKIGAEIFEGWQGIRAAQAKYFKQYSETDKGEFLMVGASKDLPGKLDQLFNDFHKKRSTKRIPAKLLFNENNRTYGQLKKIYNPVDIRFLPKHIITPSWISTYKDQVLIGVSDSKQPMAFVIINPNVAKSYRNYFHFMWDQSLG